MFEHGSVAIVSRELYRHTKDLANCKEVKLALPESGSEYYDTSDIIVYIHFEKQQPSNKTVLEELATALSETFCDEIVCLEIDEYDGNLQLKTISEEDWINYDHIIDIDGTLKKMELPADTSIIPYDIYQAAYNQFQYNIDSERTLRENDRLGNLKSVLPTAPDSTPTNQDYFYLSQRHDGEYSDKSEEIICLSNSLEFSQQMVVYDYVRLNFHRESQYSIQKIQRNTYVPDMNKKVTIESETEESENYEAKTMDIAGMYQLCLEKEWKDLQVDILNVLEHWYSSDLSWRGQAILVEIFVLLRQQNPELVKDLCACQPTGSLFEWVHLVSVEIFRKLRIFVDLQKLSQNVESQTQTHGYSVQQVVHVVQNLMDVNEIDRAKLVLPLQPELGYLENDDITIYVNGEKQEIRLYLLYLNESLYQIFGRSAGALPEEFLDMTHDDSKTKLLDLNGNT